MKLLFRSTIVQHYDTCIGGGWQNGIGTQYKQRDSSKGITRRRIVLWFILFSIGIEWKIN